MHEMGIALQIMEIVNQSLPGDEDLRVKSIQLRVGKLSAVVPQSLRFCMDVVTKDTAAQGAELYLEEVPVVVECSDCGERTEIERPPFECGGCKSTSVDIISGREMVVDSIEVEEKPPGEAAGGD
ncbi:MAG: hydrogenase maturation nickel metallochaperone HypA [bacterium]